MLTADPLCNSCPQDLIPCSIPDVSSSYVYPTSDCTPNINAQYSVGDFLLPMAGNVLPMYNVFRNQFPGISYFMYEMDQALINGQLKNVWKNKLMNSLQTDRLPYDGNYVTWGEKYYDTVDFYVTQDYTLPTATIEIGIPNPSVPGTYIPTLGADYQSQGTGRIEAGDTITIYQNNPADPIPDCCENAIIKTILSVDVPNNTITIEGGATYTFREGDRIVYNWHSRGDCDLVTKTFGLIKPVAKRSYFQNVSKAFFINKCDVNKAYATPDQAMSKAKEWMQSMNYALAQEFSSIFLRGRNIGDICSSTGKPETQGILSGIFQTNALFPALGLYTSVANLGDELDIVRHIFEEILLAQASGFLTNGQTLTLACNQKAISFMLRANALWNRLTGLTYNTNDNTRKEFPIYTIITPSGNVELMQMPELDRYYKNEGVILITSRDLFFYKQRPNSSFNLETGSITKETIGFRFADATLPTQHECKQFDVLMDVAQVIPGLQSGVHRFISGIHC